MHACSSFLRFLLLLICLSGLSCSGADNHATAHDAYDVPPEARATLNLIRHNGPFPHRQDGTVFGNRERRLPAKAHGYYREYTVATPGARDRGARRIVTGGNPPEVFYYTEDHYRSFRRLDITP